MSFTLEFQNHFIFLIFKFQIFIFFDDLQQLDNFLNQFQAIVVLAVKVSWGLDSAKFYLVILPSVGQFVGVTILNYQIVLTDYCYRFRKTEYKSSPIIV